MPAQAKIIGVHPIEEDEPVHLIELLVEGDVDKFEIGECTQEVASQPKSNWQAPRDERVLDESETRVRYAFFFHYIDLEKPLLIPAGPLQLPTPKNVPRHLMDIEYDLP